MTETETVRLFTALAVPAEVKQQVAALPQVKLDFKRISHPDDLHVTLRYLGEVDASHVDTIAEALSGMRRIKGFQLEAVGLGLFRRKSESTLYVNIARTKALSLLYAEVTGKLVKEGFVFTDRDFTPHVTVARLRNERNFEEYRSQNGRSIYARWPVEAFHLMKSAQHQDGKKRYTILRSFPLSPY